MKKCSDEAEETLSLCDLPLYSTDGGSVDWGEDLSTESQGGLNSTSSLEQDYFEFSSQEMSTSTIPLPPEYIIFCGKIIPYKQPAVPAKKDSKLVENKKMRGIGLFWLKLNSLFCGKSVEKNIEKKSLAILPESSKRMSILTSSSSGKARWYLLLFGITKFSTEMELRDMKNRQSRRQSNTSSPKFTFKRGEDKFTSTRTSREMRAWGLIRALSCGGGRHTDAV
ncbi:uncharacterized protein LOC111394879 [Olea europaea var. sylvestris]|uniref:uncharacterized protein LOC111394879 n=1 Tax=Olea europaea var. sylvestris TaxID=158386 RepID=UPI000C1D47C4|nr:uncharacterized protein LOC111394879 [Olea europaea var. sylvestris]